MPSALSGQIEAIKAEFASRPPGLIRHVERVRVEALELADRYDVDPERTDLAVWGHDLFRATAPAELLRMAQEAGLAVEPADEAEPVLLHGPVAAVLLRKRFGITDDEALSAVHAHTLGLAEMPLLAKIILIADKVEERKRSRTPVMKEIRRLAWRDLDLALLCWADWKWVDERAHGWASHPAHWRARGEWVREHHLDAAMPGRVGGEAFESTDAPLD